MKLEKLIQNKKIKYSGNKFITELSLNVLQVQSTCKTNKLLKVSERKRPIFYNIYFFPLLKVL